MLPTSTCGFDGRPVQFLAGFIYSFIYVDYGIEKACLRNKLDKNGFTGYRLAAQRPLGRDEVAPSEWEASFPRQFKQDREKLERFRDFIREPFAIWCVFERENAFGPSHGPERFSLVYLVAEGITAYQELYVRRPAGSGTHPAGLLILELDRVATPPSAELSHGAPEDRSC